MATGQIGFDHFRLRSPNYIITTSVLAPFPKWGTTSPSTSIYTLETLEIIANYRGENFE